ncbi:cytosine permease [Granulicella arctica]|uniref:cytosine permease n=1 Tax=Granulicella arctica TaxID=940613 RepID=UPI0021DFA976|nr:cytosine permease [Granulicella arctica]
MARTVPQYVECSIPVPQASRTPWYKSTFPTYAGIFLWVGFYLKLAEPTISNASLTVCLLALLVAGLLCFGLYYYVPAMLGMKTGQPLYVVGTSTFGTTGGYLIPGLLMGLLQVGWVAVVSSVSANFIMKGLNQTSRGLFILIVVLWVYSLGWVAIRGIHYVGQAAKFLNWIPLIMILIVLWANRSGIAQYQPAHHDSVTGFLNVLAIVIGYFATAGAAGADFGMNNANRKDVVLGGLFGIVLGVLLAGGLSILSVAGYLGRGIGVPSYEYSSAISSVGGLAPVMFFLFAAASLVPTCFSSFIAANSFSTMLPKIPRSVSTFAALTVSALMAVTGIADNLVGFFGIVGASFGPICGAMVADYLLAGRRWSGPRLGVNWAGCIAWAIGFLVGIPEHIPGLPAAFVKADNPSGLYSFIVGFLVYLVLAKSGLRPPVVAPKALASA